MIEEPINNSIVIIPNHLSFCKNYVIYSQLEKLKFEEYILNIVKKIEKNYNIKSEIFFGKIKEEKLSKCTNLYKHNYYKNHYQYQIFLPVKICITNLANIIYEILPDLKIDSLTTNSYFYYLSMCNLKLCTWNNLFNSWEIKNESGIKQSEINNILKQDKCNYCIIS